MSMAGTGLRDSFENGAAHSYDSLHVHVGLGDVSWSCLARAFGVH